MCADQMVVIECDYYYYTIATAYQCLNYLYIQNDIDDDDDDGVSFFY